ncbi:MAG: hypothetical protein U0T83_02480 [Bacteriovoracaceae bacterium]
MQKLSKLFKISAFLLLFMNAAFPREIISIYHNDNNEKLTMILKILTKEFALDEKLITVENSSECIKKDETLLLICINKTGNITFPIIKNQILKNSFSHLL